MEIINIMPLISIIIMSYLNYLYNIIEGPIKLKKEMFQNRAIFYIIVGFGLYFMHFLKNEFTEYIDLLLLLNLLLTMVVISLIDIKTRLISDNINIYLYISALLYVMSFNGGNIDNIILSFTMIGVITFIRFFLTIIFNREMIGEGDFIIMSLFILLFGIKIGLFALFTSLLIMFPISIILLIISKARYIPYLPFASITIITFLMVEESYIINILKQISLYFIGE